MNDTVNLHALIAKFHYTGLTGPDQTKSADFVGDPGLVGSGRVRSGRVSAVEFSYDSTHCAQLYPQNGERIGEHRFRDVTSRGEYAVLNRAGGEAGADQQGLRADVVRCRLGEPGRR